MSDGSSGRAPFAARVHAEAGDFETLGGEWDALLARSRCGSAFLKSAWLSAAFEHVEERGTRLHVISVRDEAGTLRGVAPFCIRRGARWMPGVLEFLGTRRVSSEYLDLVCDPAFELDVFDAVWDCLERGPRAWEYARLSDVKESSVLVRGFRERPRSDRLHFEIEPGQICPYLPLPPTDEELHRGLSARFRGTLRRAERRMSDFGVRLLVAEGAAALAPALDRLYELHALRWGHRGETGKLRDSEIQRFHRVVAERLGEAGGARVYSLELRGVTIAALYGLEYKGTFFFYQSGFDPSPPDASIAAWDYSPGAWVLHAAIRDSARRGLAEFDFLRGAEAYKSRWTALTRRTFAVVILPTDRWKGRVYHGLGVGVRRAKRRIRSWLDRSRRSPSARRASV